jgi:ABC-type uncharacterized transport system substrate-binding protein
VAERRAAWFALLVVILAMPVRAAGVVVLTQSEVEQYAQVVRAFEEQLPGVAVVDVSSREAVDAAEAGGPEVVVAVGSKAFDLAKARFHGKPIVAAAVLGPDRGGRREVTAVPLEPRPEDALAALAALAPAARRVLALFPPSSAATVAEAKRAAQKSGLTVDFQPLPDLAGFQALFRSAAAGHQAIWLLPDPRLARMEILRFMVSSCLEQRVALVGFLEAMTRAGALASVSADFAAIGKSAAALAQKLSGKSAPREVPYSFARGKVSVNARTREVLGLGGDLPEGAVLIR